MPFDVPKYHVFENIIEKKRSMVTPFDASEILCI